MKGNFVIFCVGERFGADGEFVPSVWTLAKPVSPANATASSAATSPGEPKIFHIYEFDPKFCLLFAKMPSLLSNKLVMCNYVANNYLSFFIYVGMIQRIFLFNKVARFLLILLLLFFSFRVFCGTKKISFLEVLMQ